MTSAAIAASQLSALARLRGVQLSYTGHDGRRVRASRESLLAILTALGHPVDDARSIASELRLAESDGQARMLEPVMVVQRGGTLSAPVRVAHDVDLYGGRLTIEFEDGAVVRHSLGEVATATTTAGGRVDVAIDLGPNLPPGYHQLVVEVGGAAASALLLAPPRMPQPPSPEFGVFAPLYALRGADDWGIGSYRDLATFADWIGEHGGTLAGTLPLFAGFTGPPMDPSPYLPVSRRFWNDLFIDVTALPEFASSPTARELAGSADFQADLASQRATATVDYDAVAARKRAVIARCAAELVEQPSRRREDFETFVKAGPELERYADFRATDEQLGTRWPQWSAAPGDLPATETDSATVLFHRYVQFVAAQQLADAASRRAGLYLDLPVGVHPDGYDTWSHAALFAPAGVGAPPDGMFANGQSWGFPPLHPERLRDSGYRYLIDSYRHVLAHARAVRIDHVLGLQRLFWIPSGGDATSGAYVGNRRDELLAIIAIEAARAETVVIGEDLGLVSPTIRGAMDRDGMLHTWVWRFNASAADPLPSPRKPSVASLGTHDLPRFAVFWRGEDIDEREQSGEIDPAAAAVERHHRDQLIAAVAQESMAIPAQAVDSDGAVRSGLHTCLRAIAAGDAPYLMIDLADLELDTVPDNRPGTGPEAGNWRRRLTRPLADIAADESVTSLLTDIATRRLAATGKEHAA